MTNVMLYALFAAGNLTSVITAKKKGWKIAHLIIGMFCIGMIIKHLN